MITVINILAYLILVFDLFKIFTRRDSSYILSGTLCVLLSWYVDTTFGIVTLVMFIGLLLFLLIHYIKN
jgi:hypothetical protein